MEGVGGGCEVQGAGLGQATVLLLEQVQNVVAGVRSEVLSVGDGRADGRFAVGGNPLQDTGEVVAGVHAPLLQSLVVGGGRGIEGEEAQQEPLAFSTLALFEFALVVGVHDGQPAAEAAQVLGHQHGVGVEAQPVAGALQGQERAGVLGWERVAVGLEGDAAAARGAHASGLDGRIRLGMRGQELRALGGEGVEGTQAGLGVDAHVGHAVQPQACGGGELGEGVELAAAQEALLHVRDGVFHDALGLRMRGSAGLDLETVVTGEVEVLGVKKGWCRGGVRARRSCSCPPRLRGAPRPAPRRRAGGRRATIPRIGPG